MEATKPTVWEFPVMQEHVHSWSEYQLYQSVPQWLVSSQNALYSPLERESLRDETKGCERDYSCNRYSNRENHSSTVSRLKYKIPRNFIPKSKLKLLYPQ